MTLAPRSWPSRPGFATSTRIFRSGIAIHLTTEATEGHRLVLALVVQMPLRSKSFDIQTPPQIPASDTAIWLPALRDLLHLRRLGQLDLPLAAFLRGLPGCGLRPLHVEIVLEHCHLYAVVARGKHVRTPEREHQKHVRCPHPNA